MHGETLKFVKTLCRCFVSVMKVLSL